MAKCNHLKIVCPNCGSKETFESWGIGKVEMFSCTRCQILYTRRELTKALQEFELKLQARILNIRNSLKDIEL